MITNSIRDFLPTEFVPHEHINSVRGRPVALAAVKWDELRVRQGDNPAEPSDRSVPTPPSNFSKFLE